MINKISKPNREVLELFAKHFGKSKAFQCINKDGTQIIKHRNGKLEVKENEEKI